MRNTQLAREVIADDRGVTFVETVVSIAILGLVAVAFLSGLATADRATAISERRVTAESLARSQVEHVKSQAYIDHSVPGHGEYQAVATPAGYGVGVATVPIDPSSGQPLPLGQDVGIQKVTVTVQHGGNTVLSIDDYKVAR